MEWSGAESSETDETPREPIIVLGEQNDYLFIGSTVKETVGITGNYLSQSGGDRLRLDELEFFDLAGRPLDPVGVGGQLDGLVVRAAENHQEEIRDRIREIAQETERIIRNAKEGDFAFGQPPLKIPDETVSFDEFIRKLANENSQLKAPPGDDRIVPNPNECNWIRRVAGKC